MKKDPRLEVHTSDLGFSFCVRDGSKSMIAGMNKSGKYGAELKFSVKSMDVMKVMVKSDSKSSNDALKGTMAQIKGEDYTDLQADAPDIKETNTIMLDEYMKSENQSVSFKQFVEANTIPFLVALKILFALIIAVIVIFARQRAKIAKVDALTGLYNRYGIRDYMKRLYEKSNQISNVIDILRTGGYNMRYLWGRCLRYVDASMCVLKAK